MQAPVPENEKERLAALYRYRILDTAPEPEFNTLAELAARICKAPMGAVSFVDSDRQWLKARVGIDIVETSRDTGFCSHAILQKNLFVVKDASADERFASNTLVTGPPHIRFYAGAPLITPDGYALGTLCVIDCVSSQLSPEQSEALRALSSQLVSQLELRRTTSALRDSEEFKSRLIASSRDCVKVLDLEGRLLFMNEGGMQALEICDLAAVLNSPWVEFWHGEDRESARSAIEGARNGETRRFEGYFATQATGEPRWWDVVVSPILNAKGEPERLLALSRDITQRRRNEIALREASQFNQQIIESAAQGIMVCDSELRYPAYSILSWRN